MSFRKSASTHMDGKQLSILGFYYDRYRFKKLTRMYKTAGFSIKSTAEAISVVDHHHPIEEQSDFRQFVQQGFSNEIEKKTTLY